MTTPEGAPGIDSKLFIIGSEAGQEYPASIQRTAELHGFGFTEFPNSGEGNLAALEALRAHLAQEDKELSDRPQLHVGAEEGFTFKKIEPKSEAAIMAGALQMLIEARRADASIMQVTGPGVSRLRF